jgi:hypothetical protein
MRIASLRAIVIKNNSYEKKQIIGGQFQYQVTIWLLEMVVQYYNTVVLMAFFRC